MESKELRIGNLINQGVEGLSFVSGYQIYQISTTENGGIQYCQDWTPIPLTEEWLLKFGFYHYDRDKLQYCICGDSIVYDLRDFRIRISDSWEWQDIRYVHSLQNLYFALTGDELTINNQP